MRSSMLVFAVLLTLLLGGVVPVASQEATPGTAGEASGATIEPLAVAELDELPPAPAFLGLARLTFAPGAATPAGSDPGPVVGYVESGQFSAAFEGPAQVTRATEEGMPGETPAEAAAAETLQTGDAVLIPSGTSSSFHNDGQDEATLLIAMVLPEDPFGSMAQTMLDNVAVEILVGGTLASIPSPPAVLVLARQTLAPGGGFPAEESLGPVLAYAESGRATYTVESGTSVIRHSRRGATPEAGQRPWLVVAPGSDTGFGPGDALIEEAGTVSGALNTGDAPHVHLVVLLGSAEAFAGMAAPASATPAA